MDKISPSIKIDDKIIHNKLDFIENRQKISLYDAYKSNDLFLWFHRYNRRSKSISFEEEKSLRNYYELLFEEEAKENLDEDLIRFHELMQSFSEIFIDKQALKNAYLELLKYEVFLADCDEDKIKNSLFNNFDNVIAFAHLIGSKATYELNVVERRLRDISIKMELPLEDLSLYQYEHIKWMGETEKSFILISMGKGTKFEILNADSSIYIDIENFSSYKYKLFKSSNIKMINPAHFSDVWIVEVEDEN